MSCRFRLKPPKISSEEEGGIEPQSAQHRPFAFQVHPRNTYEIIFHLSTSRQIRTDISSFGDPNPKPLDEGGVLQRLFVLDRCHPQSGTVKVSPRPD